MTFKLHRKRIKSFHVVCTKSSQADDAGVQEVRCCLSSHLFVIPRDSKPLQAFHIWAYTLANTNTMEV